jgi:large repetitive protein
MKSVKKAFAFALIACAFSSSAFAGEWTERSVHDSGEINTYKRPNQKSFTGPFDYSPINTVRSTPIPGPTGKCNCFTFDGTKSYSGNGEKLTYAWDFGDGTTSDQAVVRHCFEKAGDYNIALTVTDESGKICGDGTAVTRVSANFPPTANAGPEVRACLGETTSFDASASTASGNPTYKWDFGDGGLGEGQTVTHTYEQPGNYRVRLTVDDGKNTECSLASAATTAIIADRVDVKLATDGKSSTCVNRALRFNANGSSGSKYHWDFGDGITSEGGSSVSHAYNKAGDYTVTVTADNGEGSSCSVATDRTSVKVYESPIADAGENLACCIGQETAFDGSKSVGSNLKYLWNFGDGNTAEGVRVNHAYQKGGNYRVVLTVDDGSGSECSTSSSSFVANVNTKPEAVIEVR